MVTTRDASPTPQVSRKSKPRKFFEVRFERGDGSWDFEIENKDKLRYPGHIIMGPPPGQQGFPDFPESPRLVIRKKRQAPPRDLNPASGGYWIVSDRMKSVLETVDPDGFAFAACESRFRDGTPAPVYWLCDVIRVLDALDEENSTVNVYYDQGVKKYDPIGKGVAFKEDVVGAAHIFLMKRRESICICDDVLQAACKAAGLRGIKFKPASAL